MLHNRQPSGEIHKAWVACLGIRAVTPNWVQFNYAFKFFSVMVNSDELKTSGIRQVGKMSHFVTSRMQVVCLQYGMPNQLPSART